MSKPNKNGLRVEAGFMIQKPIVRLPDEKSKKGFVPKK